MVKTKLHICRNCGSPPGHKGVFILEKLEPDGSLDVRQPFCYATEREINAHYYRSNNLPIKYLLEEEDKEVIRKWYADQGWRYRPKTW